MATKENKSDIKLAIWFDENGDKHEVTITEYQRLESDKNKEKIADFIYYRLYGRYLKPFQYDDRVYREQYKNGFSIMANCCLLIETLQSFKKGWENSNGKSKEAFHGFFAKEANFCVFKCTDFYHNVRCGILHQGETIGGWKISRACASNQQLFDKENLVINANIFMDMMNKSLITYSDQLKKDEWDSEIWTNFRKKMDNIISNCTNKM